MSNVVFAVPAAEAQAVIVQEQMSKDIDGRFHLLLNPYPILPIHFTIPQKKHQPQRIKDNYGEIHRLLDLYPELMVFYMKIDLELTEYILKQKDIKKIV